MEIFKKCLQGMADKGVLTIGVVCIMLQKAFKLPDPMGPIAYGITTLGAIGFLRYFMMDYDMPVASLEYQELVTEIERLISLLQEKKRKQEELRAAYKKFEALKQLLVRWNRDMELIEYRIAKMHFKTSHDDKDSAIYSSESSSKTEEDTDDITKQETNLSEDNQTEERFVHQDKITKKYLEKENKVKVEKFLDEKVEKMSWEKLDKYGYQNLEMSADEELKILDENIEKCYGKNIEMSREGNWKICLNGNLAMSREEKIGMSHDESFGISHEENIRVFEKYEGMSNNDNVVMSLDKKVWNLLDEMLEKLSVEDVPRLKENVLQRVDENLPQCPVKNVPERDEENAPALTIENAPEKLVESVMDQTYENIPKLAEKNDLQLCYRNVPERDNKNIPSHDSEHSPLAEDDNTQQFSVETLSDEKTLGQRDETALKCSYEIEIALESLKNVPAGLYKNVPEILVVNESESINDKVPDCTFENVTKPNNGNVSQYPQRKLSENQDESFLGSLEEEELETLDEYESKRHYGDLLKHPHENVPLSSDNESEHLNINVLELRTENIPAYHDESLSEYHDCNQSRFNDESVLEYHDCNESKICDETLKYIDDDEQVDELHEGKFEMQHDKEKERASPVVEIREKQSDDIFESLSVDSINGKTEEMSETRHKKAESKEIAFKIPDVMFTTLQGENISRVLDEKLGNLKRI